MLQCMLIISNPKCACAASIAGGVWARDYRSPPTTIKVAQSLRSIIQRPHKIIYRLQKSTNCIGESSKNFIHQPLEIAKQDGPRPHTQPSLRKYIANQLTHHTTDTDISTAEDTGYMNDVYEGKILIGEETDSIYSEPLPPIEVSEKLTYTGRIRCLPEEITQLQECRRPHGNDNSASTVWRIRERNTEQTHTLSFNFEPRPIIKLQCRKRQHTYCITSSAHAQTG